MTNTNSPRINILIHPDKKLALYQKLYADRISLTQWFNKAADAYIAGRVRLSQLNPKPQAEAVQPAQDSTSPTI